MNDGFVVDKARPVDAEAIKCIETECGLSPWSAADYAAECARQDSHFIVIRKDGAPIGFLLMRLITTDRNHRLSYAESEIFNIGITTKHRREGHAARLLETIPPKMRVHLEVRASNDAAIGFYRAHGFLRTGRRPNFYSNPTEDAIVMTREPLEA